MSEPEEIKAEVNALGFNAKAFLKTVPEQPGSYRMYGIGHEVIYVGKAKNLKKRLSQYFLKNVNSAKTLALVAHIEHIEFTVTFSETEALILENNLIKTLQPRYNILLRDDKSYPYLLLTAEHQHPGLYLHRGAKTVKGEYFGPFPDSGAARESLKLMQKIFPIRQCADTVYAHRSRPCLLAQIGKCLAPCMPMTKEQACHYAHEVNMVRMFLKGNNQALLNRLTGEMEQLSAALKFEEAAVIRDQLLTLRRVQEAQSVDGADNLDLDVLGHAKAQDLACVHVLFIRHGRILGTRSYFPQLPPDCTEEEILPAFMEQFYLSAQRRGQMPSEIITDAAVAEAEELKAALKSQYGKEVRIASQVRTDRAKYLQLAAANAKASLDARLGSVSTAKMRIEALERLLGLSKVRRMECYDISHTMGELTVASCVVFGRDGPQSDYYRRFNISGIKPGDDFAAMRQVLTRRFEHSETASVPDIIFIDGGQGQLHQAEEVLSKVFAGGKAKLPLIIGVAKGEGRKEGLETLIKGFTHERLHLGLNNSALQLVLHIRDEAHRFAITGHRARRAKARVSSALEQIAGVGPKRRQALLQHLGGRREVMRAGIDELAKVPGISLKLARTIYAALHSL